MSELQQQYGRERVIIFQDLPAIPPGAQWEDEIRNSLGNSNFLIPVITPAFIESEWCTKEVLVFLEREKKIWHDYPALKGRRRIFPIYYINIDDVDPYDPLVLTELKRLQWLNFTGLRNRNDTDEAVKDVLSNLASSLCRLLRSRAPTSPAEERNGVAQANRRTKAEDATEQRGEPAARAEDDEDELRRVRIAGLKAANEAEIEAARARKRDEAAIAASRERIATEQNAEAKAKRDADERADHQARTALQQEELRQARLERLKAANEAEIEAAQARKRGEMAQLHLHERVQKKPEEKLRRSSNFSGNQSHSNKTSIEWSKVNNVINLYNNLSIYQKIFSLTLLVIAIFGLLFILLNIIENPQIFL